MEEDSIPTPNILLICADMIGAKNLGCYGDPAQVTPNIDRLARKGTQFEQAYCACPPCIPARVSMMSGQYAHTHGKIAHLKMHLRPRPPLIPEILASHGYRTGLVGKTHWWPPTDTLGCQEAHITIDNHLTPELGTNDAYLRFLRDRGLFEYHKESWTREKQRLHPDNLPDDCLKVNWTGDTARTLLEQFAQHDEPFLLFCSFVEPHGPGSVKTEFLEQFQEVSLPPIIGHGQAESQKPETQRKAISNWDTTDAAKDAYRRGVYASLNLVDTNVGKLIATLERLHLDQQTIVIFLTDHGDLLYDHGCIEKTFLYEPAIRIPWIMLGPGIPEGASRTHFVSQIDLLPTILDYCGISTNSNRHIEGNSLRSIIDNAGSVWRDTLYCEVEQTLHITQKFVSASSAKMLRRGPWKYIYTLVDGHKVEEELYHLENDPDELYNRVSETEQQKRMAQFRDELLRWLVATEVNRLHPEPENHYPVPRIETRYF
jgi:arylsulfatase A-like enzyme